jgi:hypothetical protein
MRPVPSSSGPHVAVLIKEDISKKSRASSPSSVLALLPTTPVSLAGTKGRVRLVPSSRPPTEYYADVIRDRRSVSNDAHKDPASISSQLATTPPTRSLIEMEGMVRSVLSSESLFAMARPQRRGNGLTSMTRP